jgi:hypothetical protein
MWEKIDEHTERMRIPSGWIVRSCVVLASSTPSVAIDQVIVADSTHSWVIDVPTKTLSKRDN